MTEKKELKNEIEQLKKKLEDYLKIYPILGVAESERDRVVNQMLDDILSRQEKIKELK